MLNVNSSLATRILWLASLCGALGLAGCGDDKIGKTVPVSGKVTLGGQPLTAGMVVFMPDAGRGNTSKLSASGTIGADGTYKLQTETKAGAPPGWYKVSINTNVPPSGDMQGGLPPKAVVINPLYNDPNQSGIAFEVTESPAPNAYDISLKR